MIVLIIYILFAIINMVICSIAIYIDYNDGEGITLGDIYIALILSLFSLLGTIWIIICILNRYCDLIVLQKKK